MIRRKVTKLLRWIQLTGVTGLLAVFGVQSNLHAASANIAWVSFHPADDAPSAAAAGAGFAQAPDVEYTRILESAGHTVTRYVTTATPDVDFLNTFDLVIISRSVPSGHYDTPESNALWHGITSPTMVLGGYVLRFSRLGYTYGDVMVDTTETIHLVVNDPAHPIFDGIELDPFGTTVKPYAHRVTYNDIVQSGISVNIDFPVAGAMVLATVGTLEDPAYGGTIIAEYPSGTVMGNDTFDVTAGERLVFLTGSRESGLPTDAAGIFDLNADGVRMFLNAVSYMAGVDPVEPPPLVNLVRPAFGETEYYSPLGLTARATSGHASGIPEGNISLVLNGEDVTSSLEISGTPQDRTITYMGLVPDTAYTGVLTVTDASSLETSLNISFDTFPPAALPAGFAYPVAAAVTDAPGMTARIVQGPDFPVFANTSARAEAQLAGTLINPDTLLPYVNWATPSTDNPDGAYNQQVINWSVNAGLLLEAGNFQDPEFPDQPIPGMAHNLNIAAEIITYLELSEGRHFMGVNSDDGFVLYTGVNHRDVLAVDLARFDGGRAAADTLFQFEVTEAGLYPFRLVYYQGDGDGSLEWFSVDPETGDEILINDRDDDRAIRAWREISASERPYITSIQPAPGQEDVVLDSAVTVTLQDAGALVEEDSVTLSINGEAVSPEVSKTGGVTTVQYIPAEDLPSDTLHSVDLAYTDSEANDRTANFEFTTRFIPEVELEAANIVFVSFHPQDDEPSADAAAASFTNASDVGYTRLLEQAGHTVTRYVTTATPDVAYLNTFDLVIISRAVPSGNYQSEESTALWHGITAPTLHLGGYILRANRLGFTTGDGIPDTSSEVLRLTVNSPDHPVFSGIPLDSEGNMINEYAERVTFNGTLQRGISVNNSPIIEGGTVLATVGTAGDSALGGMIIGEYPAGTTMGNAGADVTAGKRLVFLTGSRENDGLTSQGAGIYDLESDGARMFLNAVRYMAGLSQPAAVSLDIGLSGAGELVISWSESGSEGYVLEAASSLAPADWQAFEGTTTVVDGQVTATVPTTGTARFFRLAAE